jgi:hypothetical protein
MTPEPPDPTTCPMCHREVAIATAVQSGHRVLISIPHGSPKFLMQVSECYVRKPAEIKRLRIAEDEYEALKQALNALPPPTWYQKKSAK